MSLFSRECTLQRGVFLVICREFNVLPWSVLSRRREGTSDNRHSTSYVDKTQMPVIAASPYRLPKSVVRKGKVSPYSITERRVPELIPVLGSQPAGDVSHKPGGRLPLLSARPAVTLATIKRAATDFAAW